jgi:hypothetical protein
MNRKHIPGTTGFQADRDGNIYDAFGRKRNTYLNGDGYVTASVYTTDGRWVTFGVHRLVALAWLSDKRGPGCDEVNHRDGDIKNNRVENLEWVTSSQNNIHSEIMRRCNIYPTIMVEADGVMRLANDAWAAQSFTGVNVLDIWDAIKDGTVVQGFKFTHFPYRTNIPTQLHKPRLGQRDVNGRMIERSIKTLDIDTGEIEVFTSFAKAAARYNTTASQLHLAIPRRGEVRVFRKKYQVEYMDQDFPEMTLEELARAKNRGPRPVLAYNIVTKKYAIYESAKSFITAIELRKKAVTTSLVKGKLRQIGDWVAVYVNTENAEKLKEYVKGPADT